LVKKVLIIRFSSIGDIVLTTPVVRCMKVQRPDIEIHYFTKKAFVGIVENNPYISKVHSFEKKISEVIKELKREKFDFVIDLHNNLRSLQTKQLLGKPSSTFTKLNFKKLLLVKLKVDTMPDIHVVDRYMKTVKKLGIVNDNKGVDYFIPMADEVKLEQLPLTHQHGYVGFVIGAQHFTKQLPTAKIIAICKKNNRPIVVIGGKDDQPKAQLIADALGGMVYNACGKYNLNQSASLVRQADQIFSHDTGLMHIAAAFKKDITSFWGSTVPAFGFTPYLPGAKSHIVEVKGLSCRPCSKIGYNKCPKGHFKCMETIDIKAIRLD
jgi:ADP-heptose:LPS heptosyltransferase